MIEILAPAGDEAQLRAAVYSGADCVYVGIEGFNARRGAANFGGQGLAEAVAFCRARGCGVYGALNTLVQPGEQAALDAAVLAARDAGVDAVIVQDMATALRVQQLAPGLPLHASTQMSVHSLAGVLELAELGFARVILSRELSLAEIAYIAQHSPVELEVFVHGALCVCVSGQCTMSAFLGGRSANRGGCAGPCRLPFRAQAEAGGREVPAGEEHHLSLKDLSVLDALPELEKIGVVSAKIEGRLRGPEYCAVVVDAARKAREGQPYDKQLLQQVFSRSGFTDGWFTGENGPAMFGTRTAADTAAVKQALPAARELYRRERPRVAVTMRLAASEAGGMLWVSDGALEASAAIPGPLPPAQKPQDVEAALRKTGGTPFYVEAIQADAGEVFLPSALLNAARRQALEALLRLRAVPKEYTAPHGGPPLVKLYAQAVERRVPREVAAPQLYGHFEKGENIPAQAGELCIGLVVPLWQWGTVPQHLRGKTWLALPRVLFGGQEQRAAEEIRRAAGEGFCGFEVQGAGGIRLCKGYPMRGGLGLNITNSASLAVYTALGCGESTLSAELSLAKLRAITPYSATDMVVYGHLPVMFTRAQPLSLCGSPAEGVLVDRKGRAMRVKTEDGVSRVYNPVPLWMGDRLDELPTHTATLYFTNESAKKAERILRAFANREAAPSEFTRGLYDKGSI